MKFQIIVNIWDLCQLVFKIKYQQQVPAPSNPEHITYFLHPYIAEIDYVIFMKPFMVSCGIY